MQRRSIIKAMAAAAASTAVGAGATTAQPRQGAAHRIALILGPGNDGFYRTLRIGAEAAADALGVELIASATLDPIDEVELLDALIARRANAIVIAPGDTARLIGPLRRAHDAGIAVITVDTVIGRGRYRIGSGEAGRLLAHVGSDNVLAGRLAARALGAAVGGTGKVYVANARSGVSSADQRETGFRSEIGANFPNIEVLETQFCANDANTAARQLGDMLVRNNDLKGVFGANVAAAKGAAEGVLRAGCRGSLKVVAFDAPSSIVAHIHSGLVDVAIAQHPAEMGYCAVVSASAHLGGKAVPSLAGTGLTVIDKSNVSDPEVAKYIYAA